MFLYQVIFTAFSVLVILSNILSAKMVALPFVYGGEIPAGLLTYPLTFLLSDLVTELFGVKRAKRMVYTAFAMCLLSYFLIAFSLVLPSSSPDTSYTTVLGLSGLRIASSLAAYLVAQLADVQMYALIKHWTGPKYLWLRANGSMLIAQLIDTFLIDVLYFYWGMGMAAPQVLAIMLFSFSYKALFSVANTPLFYLSLFLIKKIRGRKKLEQQPYAI